MNPIRLSTVATAVGVWLLAFAGPAAAQGPSYPTPPNPATPSQSPDKPENPSSLTTTPDRTSPMPQDDPLYHLLQRLQMPQPSGEVKKAPTDAAVLVVRVPDAAAEVLIDGEPTYTAGRTRYFVTPYLPDGQTAQYEVSVRWKQGGEGVTRKRNVKAEPGRITIVDCTYPADK